MGIATTTKRKMLFDNIKLPMPVQFILNKLNDNGYEGFIVGGCVRDCLLGIKPHDWDICTSALPEQVMELFKDFKVIPTGIKHGTVSVVFDDKPENIFEITTYRIDGEYKDNRHPETVKFVTDLELDLSRRDFTINAIAYNEVKGIVDPFGGYNDIIEKRIKCVGNPNDRINEDALRIMRAIRFALRFNCDIDSETLSAIHKNKDLLKKVSAERINSELTKILSYPLLPFNPSEYKKTPYNERIKTQVYILFYLIESVVPWAGFLNDRKTFYRLWFANSSNCALNLAIILGSNFGDKTSFEILKQLRFSNEIIDSVGKILQYADEINKSFHTWVSTNYGIFPSKIKISKYYARKLLHNLDYITINLALDCAKVFSIYSDKPPISQLLYLECIEKLREEVNKCRENGDVYDLKYLAVDGTDLILLGYKGKIIGEILDSLLEMVMKDEIPNSRDSLIYTINTTFAGDCK